jgi:hypothetical protein
MKKKTVIIIGIICFIVAAAIAPWKVIANSVADSLGYEIDWYRVEAFFQLDRRDSHQKDVEYLRQHDKIENQIGTEQRQPESEPKPQAVAVEQPQPQYDPHAPPLEFMFKHPDGCVTCEAVDNQLQQYADVLIPAMGFRPPRPDDRRILVIRIDHLPPTSAPAGQPEDDRYYQCGQHHCTALSVCLGYRKSDGEVQILYGPKEVADIVSDAPYAPSVWDDNYSGPGRRKPYRVAVGLWLSEYYSLLRQARYEMFGR